MVPRLTESAPCPGKASQVISHHFAAFQNRTFKKKLGEDNSSKSSDFDKQKQARLLKQSVFLCSSEAELGEFSLY